MNTGAGRAKKMPTGREARRWAGIVVLAGLVAGAAYLLNGIVDSKARQLTQEEISAVAEDAAFEAEAPLSATAKSLAEMARGGGVDCLRETLARFSERIASIPIIAALNLVDANGFLMCSTGGNVGESPGQILPALTPRMPPVTISVDPRSGKSGLLVSWTATTGMRLVAELASNVPRIPQGPALTRGRVGITLLVGDKVWRSSGAILDPAAETISASVTGRSFPIVAKVAVPAEPVPAEFKDIGRAIRIGAALIIGALFGFGWFGREKKQRRPAAQVAATGRATTVAYRPVIEVTNGTIVGIDAVAEGTTDAIVSDIHFIDRVLTEGAPILRVHPTLKLSLPSVSDPRALTRLAQSLSQALPRFSVQPGQIVVAATPGTDEATAKALDMVRAAGLRLSLDGIASGGGAGLMALGRHRPDFITIDGALAADDEPQALTILEALVGIARELDVGVIMRDVAEVEQVERLRGVGITTATGPAFGPPLRAHLIASLVAAATLDAEKRVRIA